MRETPFVLSFPLLQGELIISTPVVIYDEEFPIIEGIMKLELRNIHNRLKTLDFK